MNFHGPPRGRQPGRCELLLCRYIHSDIQDEEWPRQTSGHGFWWFIFVVCFFSILSTVVENKARDLQNEAGLVSSLCGVSRILERDKRGMQASRGNVC